MAKKIIMPKLGMTMKEGILLRWFKKEGDTIEKGEPLFELESEKVVSNFPSPESGKLLKIVKTEGDTVPVSDVIAIIGSVDEEFSDKMVVTEEYAPTIKEETVPEEKELRPLEKEASEVKISPLARKLALEQGLEIPTIVGSGPGGRIVKSDILQAIEKQEKTVPLKEQVIALDARRKRLIDRLSKSYSEALHVTIHSTIDVTELIHLKNKFEEEVKKKIGGDLTYTHFFIKAVAQALTEFPLLNSRIEGDHIYLCEDVNIGLAAAIEDGLIVPVIRNADKKTLPEIITEVKTLIEKVRSNNYTINDVTGGTFTISNLGMYGIDSFTPIINPPECAILGIGRIVKQPVFTDDEIEVRSTMTFSLSFDHRIIDGVVGAQFQNKVKEILENPYTYFFTL